MTANRLRVRDVVTDQVILVSRPSARLLLMPLRQAAAAAGTAPHGSLIIDFEGIEGMAPSFLDEFLAVLHEALGKPGRVQFVNQPARLSRKFETVARGRGLQVAQEGDGRWLLTPQSDTAKS